MLYFRAGLRSFTVSNEPAVPSTMNPAADTTIVSSGLDDQITGVRYFIIHVTPTWRLAPLLPEKVLCWLSYDTIIYKFHFGICSGHRPMPSYHFSNCSLVILVSLGANSQSTRCIFEHSLKSVLTSFSLYPFWHDFFKWTRILCNSQMETRFLS